MKERGGSILYADRQKKQEITVEPEKESDSKFFLKLIFVVVALIIFLNIVMPMIFKGWPHPAMIQTILS